MCVWKRITERRIWSTPVNAFPAGVRTGCVGKLDERERLRARLHAAHLAEPPEARAQRAHAHKMIHKTTGASRS